MPAFRYMRIVQTQYVSHYEVWSSWQGGGEDFGKADIHEVLDRAGANGWELVSVSHVGSGTNYWFKQRVDS